MPGLNWPEVADFWTYRRVNAQLRHHDFDIIHSIGPNTARPDVVISKYIQPAKRKILDRFAKDEKISPLRRLTRWLYLEVTSSGEKLYTRRPGRCFCRFPGSRNETAQSLRYRRLYRAHRAQCRRSGHLSSGLCRRTSGLAWRPWFCRHRCGDDFLRWRMGAQGLDFALEPSASASARKSSFSWPEMTRTACALKT